MIHLRIVRVPSSVIDFPTPRRSTQEPRDGRHCFSRLFAERGRAVDDVERRSKGAPDCSHNHRATPPCCEQVPE